MHKLYSLFTLLILSVACFGQKAITLNDSATIEILDYAVLPDRGYAIDQVATDSSLRFVVGDSLRPLRESVYWIKIKVNNPFHYAEKYNIRLLPYLNNTLYYFDANSNSWVAEKAGIYAGLVHRNQRAIARMPFMMRENAMNTVFVRMEVAMLREFGHVIKPEIQLRKQVITDEREQTFWVGWVAALSILLLFFLNNLFIYFSFRDKAILYYLVAQLGGMLYITSYRFFFAPFLPVPVYSFWMSPDGVFEYYDLNSLLQHIGILAVMYGYIQFTRTYLNSSKTLPVIDKLLYYGLSGYAVISGCIIFFNLAFYCTTEFTLLIENILALLLLGCVLLACVLGYLRKVRMAGPFLLANVFPLVFMLGIAVFHVFVSVHTKETFMPELATVAQAFGFSIALITRTRMLQKDLQEKEIKTQKLEFELDALEIRKRLIELENEKINTEIGEEKIRNELLHQKLEVNQRELASTTLYIVQKNEMLAQLKQQIENSDQRHSPNKNEGLKEIKSLLNSNLYLDGDWAKFKLHFEQVHPNFFSELLTQYPSLTKNEVRLYAYFHMNLSTKEIAALLNVDPGSVRRAKSRLYKKMGGPKMDQSAGE